MKISKYEALTILEMIGTMKYNEGNSLQEDNLEIKIRKSFSGDNEITNYDYEEQKNKYGW